MKESRPTPPDKRRNRAFRRLIGSVLAAIGTLAFLVVGTVATSRNWMHDGADTVVARWFSVPWEWSFFVAASSHATGWAYLIIVAILPLCAYTLFYLALFSVISAFRPPRRHELDRNA